MEKDDFFIKRIRELATLSYQRDIVTFSDFLNLNEQNLVKSQATHFPGIMIEGHGGYDGAERQIIAFYPADLGFYWEYPICCLKVEPKAAKFSQILTHRDYLGTILGLGVERSVVGDILVKEQGAWVFCHDKIADFIMENLCRVRHTAVTVSKVENPEELPAPSFSTVSGTCTSVRLDALISIAFQASRSSMVSYIEGGQVFVNGKLITSNGYEPKEGDIISVRGKGRFIFEKISGKTKKGRIGVCLLKYV